MEKLTHEQKRVAWLEAKAERAASEAERIDKRRGAVEASERGERWKRRTVRPMGFALSVLSRRVVSYTERADRIQRSVAGGAR